MKVARVAICRNAVSDERGNGRNGAVPDSSARWLSSEIARQGLGLFASAEDGAAFLQSLPTLERQRWAVLIKRRLAVVLGNHEVPRIDRQRCLDDLRRSYGDYADLVICGVSQAHRFGLPEQGGEHPEVVSLEDIAAVATLTYDETSTSRVVESGTPREQLWRERFVVLAQRVHHLVIVDRYGLSDRNAMGIVWLLQQIFHDRRDPTAIQLDIVVEARAGGAGANQVADAIQRLGLGAPDPARFRSIALHVADPQLAQCELHDRFLRFDGRVIDSGTGCAIFSDLNVYARTNLSFGSYPESEKVLDDMARQCSVAYWSSGAAMWLDEDDAALDLSRRRRTR